jgi:hypothetical protein
LKEAQSVKVEDKVEEKVLVNEFEETEAIAEKGYAIRSGVGYFTLVQDKY